MCLRTALRRDLLRHVARLPLERRNLTPPQGVSAMVFNEILERPENVDAEACDSVTAALLDSGAIAELLRAASGDAAPPVSYLSLLSQWEQLAEWVTHATDASQIRAAGVTTEYELLMYVGMVGFPIKVGRSAATQMDPFQLSVSEVRAAPADTPSLCCALESEQTVLAPEGGEVKDLLLLVD